MSLDKETRARLAISFDYTFLRPDGNHPAYATGEQVISRLNDVLGVGGWSFSIVGEPIFYPSLSNPVNATVQGHLAIRVGDMEWADYYQFGSAEIKTSRTTGIPLNLGDDVKAAATDAFKKCASYIGVGLYLWEREERPGDTVVYWCQVCGNRLADDDVPGRNGGKVHMTARQIHDYTIEKYHQSICPKCALATLAEPPKE